MGGRWNHGRREVVCKEGEGESHASCYEFRARLAVTADNRFLPQGLSVGYDKLMARKGVCQLFFHSRCRDYRNTVEPISDPGLPALAGNYPPTDFPPGSVEVRGLSLGADSDFQVYAEHSMIPQRRG